MITYTYIGKECAMTNHCIFKNIDLIVKDLLLMHEGGVDEWFKHSHLHPKLMS
jgi:hypothetical protein